MGCGSSKEKHPKSSLLGKYSLGKVLGQGAFGIVYSCTRRADGMEFAVKMIDHVETPLPEIKREVQMMHKLSHHSLVRLHNVFYEKVFVCMVLDLCKGGDMIAGMQNHWKTKGIIPMNVIQNVGRMMFESCEWLHSNNIVHRDLKGDNYLQDRKDIADPEVRVLLSDFGTVVECPPEKRLTSKRGTRTYWAPEFFDGNYGLKVDTFALGVILFGMISGRFPFKGEQETRDHVPAYPTRCEKDSLEFLQGLLQKEEASRFSAREALEHEFLATVDTTPSAPFTSEATDVFQGEVREAGANAAVKQRRLELVERLENQQAQTEAAMRTAGKSSVIPIASTRLGADAFQANFEVIDKVANRVVKFDWWANTRCISKPPLYFKSPAAKTVSGKELEAPSASCEANVKYLLTEHGISLDEFGKGRAKEFSEFVTEVQKGLSCLMLDATKHKSIVRVVDIVILRMVHVQGANRRYLVTKAEQYPDGRVREIYQLPGAKKMPHENGMQTALRMLFERFNMSDVNVSFDFSHREIAEEDEDSPSYPGVRTVYRKEVYEGVIAENSEDILARIGCLSDARGRPKGPGGANMGYSHEDDKKYTRFFEWLTEAQINQRGIALRMPEEWEQISALVPPTIGMSEEELGPFLQQHGVDPGQFGQGLLASLAELSEELLTGQSSLVLQPLDAADESKGSRLVRIVGVVALKVVRQNGDILVEVDEFLPEQEIRNTLNRLPCVGRRIDDNPFVAAHRGIERVLKVHDNFVQLNPDNVQLVEEEISEAKYGTLPTIHRRHIISANMTDLGITRESTFRPADDARIKSLLSK